jgi:hypothetical protein
MGNASPTIEAPFRLTNQNPNLSKADASSTAWTDIWKYQVPVGEQLILKPHHTFAAYLEDNETTAAEESASLTQVKIEKRDSS